MKALRVIMLSAALGSLTGCQTLQKTIASETRHSGGGAGYLLDENTPYKAYGNKQLQIYRAVVGLALIARVGDATLRDGKEVDAFVLYMKNVSDDINDLAGHVYGQGSCTNIRETTKTCNDFEQLFESDLPQLENDMIRFGVASLPRREAAKFLESVSSGNPLGIASSVWKLGKKVVVAGHSAAATARSEREIFASIATKSGQNVGSVEAAIIALKDLDPKSTIVLQRSDFEPLYLHIRDICMNLAYDLSDRKDAAQIQTDRQTACNNIKFEPNNKRYS